MNKDCTIGVKEFLSRCGTTNYGIFRSMQGFSKSLRLKSFNEIKEASQDFFDYKDLPWYFQRSLSVAERWQKVLDNDGYNFEV